VRTLAAVEGAPANAAPLGVWTKFAAAVLLTLWLLLLLHVRAVAAAA
jgi:hypothetical protein